MARSDPRVTFLEHMSVPSEDQPVPVVKVRSGLVGHPTSESCAVSMLSDQSLALPVPGTCVYSETRGPGAVGDQSPPAKGAIPRRFPPGVAAEQPARLSEIPHPRGLPKSPPLVPICRQVKLGSTTTSALGLTTLADREEAFTNVCPTITPYSSVKVLEGSTVRSNPRYR